ncbi:Eco57I restriction-modification methylase domain-containing protein [Candidatus Poriferisodalis sp.]|uniref:Eco57I restriction-modification methylase domain-containing protein n=1 Tax=Candidatus Poriferisodalis sp. TaxID=3101277 RepID=UPI003B5900B1
MTEQELAELLRHGDFGALFRRMGWDYPGAIETVRVEESDLRPVAVADKRGVTAWQVACPTGLPERSEQHRVVRRLKRFSRDQLVVFVSPDQHLWLWPEQRPSGVGHRLVDYGYRSAAPTDALLQRLVQASFALDEEDGLTATSVLARIRRSFNADKVTKSFYREFQKHHKNFAATVEGIAVDEDRRWYASVLLNRVMFIYFIQRKGFLDRDRSYLRSRLTMVRQRYGADQFFAFYKRFLVPLFHAGLGSPPGHRAGVDPEIERIIGDVPYVNGGIFEPHELELAYDIEIKDDAFESLFDFFDAWRWHLDETPTGETDEINPDILGFIFEQYINFTDSGQKENGAYYTKPDVTGYMAASTILPAVADRLVAAGLDDPTLLLVGSGDAYLHDSNAHGVKLPTSGETGGRGDGDLPPVGDAWPWQWHSGDPAEYVELPPPGEHLALPGERWCDVVHRRERYRRQAEMLSDPQRTWTVDDAITENLDLPELLRDYLSQLSNAAECDAAFEALRSLTVCDPTVGSGAFLFAALDVLEPLYSEVLARAVELEARKEPVPSFLAEARTHPSSRYWLLKTICLHNLFGVDLMRDAPEIAKLRLFLKLAAQIDDVKHLEPLPDLDFNIKCGNLLVGIADAEDAKGRLFSQRLDHVTQLQQVEDTAQHIADVFDAYIAAETDDTGQLDHSDAKQELHAKLQAARSMADTLLHEMRDEDGDLDDWVSSHQPFHWFVEFPSVWRTGGFDVIIGNPPYIKTSKVTGYRWFAYETQSCPDLYAVCMERASNLLNEGGRFAMIVMHSLAFSQKFAQLRRFCEVKFGSMWASAYWAGRMGLFTGANPRNVIVIAKNAGADGLFVTRYNRWRAEFRDRLFPSLEYTATSEALLAQTRTRQWPCLDATPALALEKMASENVQLADDLQKQSVHQLGFKTTALYQLGVYVDEPPTVDPITREPATTNSLRTGWLCFESDAERDLALVALAGRWGYLWWLTFSDEFDVTRSTLAAFPGDIKRLASRAVGNPASGDMKLESLVALSKTLQDEMPKHIAWMKKAGVDVGRYNMAKLRPLTDRADWLLAQAWGIEDAFDAAGNLRDRMVFGNRE